MSETKESYNALIPNYTKFDPNDKLCKEVFIKLREMFLETNTDADSFRYMMYMLSTTVVSYPKERLFCILIGHGSNGKSVIIILFFCGDFN